MDYTSIISAIPHTREVYPARASLLNVGDVADRYFFVLKGCLRLWLWHDDRDITLQFFFENEGASDMESLLKGTPCRFAIETVEKTELLVFRKDDMDNYLDTDREAGKIAHSTILEMMYGYMDLFLSRIRDTPEERYCMLLEKYPEILRRVPLRHIASYLGITAVSLSRIRARYRYREK